MAEVQTEFLFHAKIELRAPQLVGETPQGNRMIFIVERGTVEGPKLKGEVLPGGGDWFLVRPDGAGELDVRGTMRTDDEQLIYITYRGILHAAPEVMARIFNRQPVASHEYYFRTAPTFQTASPKYDWLNRVQAVGIGEVRPGGVAYDVYAIL
jgi:hypothetical protein